MTRDLKQDETTWDLAVDPVTKDLLVHTDAGEETAQRIRIRILTFLGEWDFDTDAGMDWLGLVFRKGADLEAAAAGFRVIILKDPEVERVRDVQITVDRETRRATVTFRADTIHGDPIAETVVV